MTTSSKRKSTHDDRTLALQMSALTRSSTWLHTYLNQHIPLQKVLLKLDTHEACWFVVRHALMLRHVFELGDNTTHVGMQLFLRATCLPQHKKAWLGLQAQLGHPSDNVDAHIFSHCLCLLCACLYIAGKLYESLPPRPSHFMLLFDSYFDAKSLPRLERELVLTWKGAVWYPSLSDGIGVLLQRYGALLPAPVLRWSRLLTYLSYASPTYMRHGFTLMDASVACVVLARWIVSPQWKSDSSGCIIPSRLKKWYTQSVSDFVGDTKVTRWTFISQCVHVLYDVLKASPPCVAPHAALFKEHYATKLSSSHRSSQNGDTDNNSEEEEEELSDLENMPHVHMSVSHAWQAWHYIQHWCRSSRDTRYDVFHMAAHFNRAKLTTTSTQRQ